MTIGKGARVGDSLGFSFISKDLNIGETTYDAGIECALDSSDPFTLGVLLDVGTKPRRGRDVGRQEGRLNETPRWGSGK